MPKISQNLIVWNQVKVAPILKSISYQALTASTSFKSNSVRLFNAFVMSWTVIAENFALLT